MGEQVAKQSDTIGTAAKQVDMKAPVVTRVPDEHHLMTNKNRVSQAAGGPYTPKFEDLAKRRGISLDDAINKVRLKDHRGPHPAYNAEVFARLDEATQGLKGDKFNNAFDKALDAIRQDTLNPGSLLNKLATGQGGGL